MDRNAIQFSFDLGTNSLGWAVLGLDAEGNPGRILDAGVRIFADGREPKSGTSLAEGRREARGTARRRDRYKRRRKAVIRTLVAYGLMPDTPEARAALVAQTNDKAEGTSADVYALRARALDEKLPRHHIGRALFHLNQRRGFRSNRKTDARDTAQGKIATGVANLQTAMDRAGARTLGEYLHMRRGTDPTHRGQVRVRPQITRDEKDRAVESYGFYPQRAMLEAEFGRIWDAQAPFYPEILTDERKAHLFRVLFYQRPLTRRVVGKCSFNPAEQRVARAHPLFQRFRLYKEVNELELVLPDLSKRKLTRAERDALVDQLRSVREAGFGALLKTIGPPAGARFNKESESRARLKGDEVAAEMSHTSRFGRGWFALPCAAQWEIVGTLRETEDPLALDAWLEERFGLDPERRDAVAAARLPEGYGRLGSTALAALCHELEDDVVPQSEAARRAGYDHALGRTGTGLDDLPPYQEVLARRIPPGSGAPDDPYDVRMGRITNPTVHIALNQLRVVTNALLATYGKPARIALELGRELKLGEKRKAEINRTIARNTRDAERRSEVLRTIFNVADNGYNRALLRFWEELGAPPSSRVCVYCGDVIAEDTLFSAQVDIDHILPWSKTLDDSRANRILVHTRCNREKGNRAPADVPEWQERYAEIAARASRLAPGKRWRFAPDAMERFDGARDFLARQLTDTQYLSRMAHEYLAALYPDEEPDEWGVFARRNHVRVIPGRLTDMLRRAWGLNTVISGHDAKTRNAKNRSDHRHHAIDAIVVGVTTRGLLARIARAAGRGADLGSEDALGRFDPPWPGFREDVGAAVARITVSHKPDHGTLPTRERPGSTAGRLHNDTAYGFTGEERDGVPIMVHRKPFLLLTGKDLAAVRDPQLRDHLQIETYGLSGRDFADALRRIQLGDRRYRGIRRVRVLEAVSVIPIKDGQGRAYKGYKGDANFRYDVWELPEGRWVERVVTLFDAHRPEGALHHRPHPAARKVLSLKQNDMVAYDHPTDGPTIARVVKFSKGMVAFAPHEQGGALKARDADKDDPFRYFYKSAGAMRAIGLRQIRIDAIGRVFDPGPQDRQSRMARKAGSASESRKG